MIGIDWLDNSPWIQRALHAAGTFFQAGGIYLTYWLARRFSWATAAVARDSGVPLSLARKLKLAAVTVFVVFVLASMMWWSTGTHHEGGDLYEGGGETVVDFDPTRAQRTERAGCCLTFFGVPALIGLRAGLKWRPDPSA